MGIPFTPATPGGYHRTMESAVHPIPGTDYPRTFHEMDQWFRTDATCRDYVRRLRWPNGFVCAECGAAGEPWTMSRDRFRCRACEWETTLTAGTVLQDTRKPLRLWFLAMWFITSQKNGSVRSGCRGNWGLAATKLPGPGCTSCGARWGVQDETISVARSKSTKPMSAARKRVNVGGEPKPRRSSLWRPKRAGAALVVSACGASKMYRRTP